MAREMARLQNPRQQLFAMLRAYIDHGVENPALYSLMFGGYLSGPHYSRPAIELAEAEKTKALLAEVIVAGALGPIMPHTARNERKIAGAILACWSLVHGLTLLLADRLVGPKNKSGVLGETVVQGYARRIGGPIAGFAGRHLDRPSSAAITQTVMTGEYAAQRRVRINSGTYVALFASNACSRDGCAATSRFSHLFSRSR